MPANSRWDLIRRLRVNIFFRALSKRALPPGSPCRAPIETDALFPELSVICLSETAVSELPSRFPSGARMKRDARV